MRAALRETHDEDRARALGALDLDRAALEFDQLLHEREADADALAGTAGITLVEAVEDVRELIARDAGARVGDDDFSRAVLSHACHAQRCVALPMRTVTVPPRGVNLSALASRLLTIFSITSRSR